MCATSRSTATTCAFSGHWRNPAPVLASIDTDALARERAYGRDDAANALESFRHARAKTLDLIGGLGDAQLARTAVFEGYGPLTMRTLVHYLCSHDQRQRPVTVESGMAHPKRKRPHRAAVPAQACDAQAALRRRARKPTTPRPISMSA